MTPSDFIAAANAAIEANVLDEMRRSPPEPRAYVYASQLHRCGRRMALDMMASGRKAIDAAGAARMLRGQSRETYIYRMLEDAGKRSEPRFSVALGQLPVTVSDPAGNKVIGGKLDGVICFQSVAVPFEVKSPTMPGRINRVEDCFSSPWNWHWPLQLLSYLYGTGEPWGLLVIDTGAIPHLLPVVFDEWAELYDAALQRVEQATAMVREGKGELPAHIRDLRTCQACPYFERLCVPPIEYGDGAGVIVDKEMLEQLEIRHRTEQAHRDFERADREVKDRLKVNAVEGQAVAGHYLISASFGKSTRVELPDELKRQYTKTDPRGRYTVKISRVGEGEDDEE